jgi:hypothetical protein
MLERRAIQTYAQTMNEREALLAQRNPDLTVQARSWSAATGVR